MTFPREKNFLAMLRSGTAGDIYANGNRTPTAYVKQCRWCPAKVVMRRTKRGAWAAYDEGTNNFHQCPNYKNRPVSRYP